MNIKELEFSKVGDCEVLECLNPQETNKKKIKFNLKCKCGNIRQVSMYHIKRCDRIHCKQCGWKKVGEKNSNPEAAFNALVWHYVKAADRRGIKFDLSRDYIREITSKNCHYCGKEPSLLALPKKGNKDQYIYNTIDRIDSSIGYFPENVVPACKQCNLAKSSMTVEEFYSFIKRVYEFNKDVLCHTSK